MRTLLSLLLMMSPALAGAAQGPAACPPEAKIPSPAQVEAGMKNARDRGFLWRATKDGRTSYLYGTIHVGRPEWLFPGPEVMRAVHASGTIALELDVLDPALVQRLQEGTKRKADEVVPKNTERRLQAQLKAACLPGDLLQALAPVMVATTLTVMSGRKGGLDPAYAVDAVYAGLGRSLGKPVQSLETPELQLGLLVGGTAAESQAAIDAALDDLESGKAAPMLARMAEVWAAGRLGELETYERWCECLETQADRAMMQKLLDERNPGLAAGIDAIHASGRTVFAAVGSLHMIGRLGLPALMAGRGYKVERVGFQP